MHVAGELDIATTPQLEVMLRRAQSQARLVVLDLRDLAFIDGAGVHAIVNATIRSHEAGRRLVLLRCPAHVERLFALTETAVHLEIAEPEPIQSAVRAHPAAEDDRGSRAPAPRFGRPRPESCQSTQPER